MKLDKQECIEIRRAALEFEIKLKSRIDEIVNFLKTKFPTIDNWYFSNDSFMNICDITNKKIKYQLIGVFYKDREILANNYFNIDDGTEICLCNYLPTKWLTEDYKQDIEAWLQQVKINQIL